MTKKSEPLLLADALDELDAQFSHPGICGEAAAKLRRLHEVNQELLEALKELKAVMPIFPKDGNFLVGYKDRYNAAQFKASAAIAKATGES